MIELMPGRGRGRQVVSVAKTADLILLMSGYIVHPEGRMLIISRRHQICRAETSIGN